MPSHDAPAKTPAHPAPPGTPDTQQAMSLLGELEERLSQLKVWQQDSDRHIADVREQTKQLQARQILLEERAQKLAAQEEAVARQATEVEKAKAALEADQAALTILSTEVDFQKTEASRRQSQIESQREALEHRQQEADALRLALEKKRADAEAREAALTEQQTAAAAARAELERRLTEFDAAEQKWTAEHRPVEELRLKLEEQQKQLEQQCTELEDRASQEHEQRAELENQWAELDAERRAIIAEREALAQAREEGAAQQRDLEKARASLDQELGTRAIAHQQLSQQREEIDRARAKLAEREQEAERARLSFTTQQAALVARQEAVKAEWAAFDAGREHLKAHQAALDAERKQLEAEREAFLADRARANTATGTDDGHSLDANTIASLTGESAEARAAIEARQAAIAAQQKLLDAERATLEAQRQDLAALRNRLEATGAQTGDAASGPDVVALKSREAELEKKIAAYQESLQQSEAKFKASREALDEQNHKFHAKADLLKRADAAVAGRRSKLKRYMKVLRERTRALDTAHNKTESTQQQYAGLLQQRQTLLEVKRFLAASEAEMVRRWSTHRAASLVIAGTLAFVFLAMFSYAVGQRVVKPVWRTAASIEMTPPADAGSGWADEQRKLLLSEPVLEEAISQLNQRGVKLFEKPADMRERLNGSLKVQSPAPGKLTMEYRQREIDGPDKEMVVFPVEALGRAFVGYQMAEDRKAGRPTTAKIVEAAARDLYPVEDSRCLVSGVLFSACLLGGVMLMLGLRWWLLRSARVFEGQEQPALSNLETADAWPDLPPTKPTTTED